MAIAPETSHDFESEFVGMRMTADEFLEIADDGHFYELIDGVVVMSPSPTPEHQQATMEVARQLANFCAEHPVGRVFPEQDVHLGRGPDGKDIVYRPELCFVRSDRLSAMRKKIKGAPDIVLEVISHGSRRLDTQTKFRDYEQFGVKEYWLLDPERDAITFYRLQNEKFVEVATDGKRFQSEAVPGFALDLMLVRRAMLPW